MYIYISKSSTCDLKLCGSFWWRNVASLLQGPPCITHGREITPSCKWVWLGILPSSKSGKIKACTLSTIIMEVENGYIWKVLPIGGIGGTHFWWVPSVGIPIPKRNQSIAATWSFPRIFLGPPPPPVFRTKKRSFVRLGGVHKELRGSSVSLQFFQDDDDPDPPLQPRRLHLLSDKQAGRSADFFHGGFCLLPSERKKRDKKI